MKTLLLYIASLAVLCAPVLALAEERGDDVQFRFTQEETETAEGAAALYERILAHSLRNCRFASDRAAPAANAKACAEELAAQFVSQIDQPLLTLAARNSDSTMLLASAE